MQHWAFLWMPITCNDDTQLFTQSTCQSYCSNTSRMLYLGHTFGRLWLKAEHGAHEQTRLLSILSSGSFYFSFLNHFFLLLFFQQIIDAALLITLVAFGLKSAYEVYTQPWLLNNLNHWSKIYFITSTVQQKFSPKLEIFSTLFLVFLALLQHSHKTQPKSKCRDRILTSIYNYLYLAFS